VLLLSISAKTESSGFQLACSMLWVLAEWIETLGEKQALTTANAINYITKSLITFQCVLKSRSDLSYKTMSTVSTFFCNLQNEKQEYEE